MCNFCPDTRGWWRSLFFGLTCSVMLCGGRHTANKYHWCVLTVIQPHWVCPCSWPVCFPSLHCSGLRFPCRKLSEASPGLHEFPRSKLLRFRFSGTPQRHRLGWACVLCLSQVRAAQVTKCLVSAVVPSWRLWLITSPVLAAWFSGCTTGVPSQVCHVFLGSWSLAATLPMLTVQNPKSIG